MIRTTAQKYNDVALWGAKHREAAFGSAEVTLDGKRAKISGFVRRFATVATLPTGPSAEYSWATVALVIAERDGAFKS